MDCSTDKTVSVVDRWQYLYHLRYPERKVPDPGWSVQRSAGVSANSSYLDLQRGPSNPHGEGKPRPQRRQGRQSSDLSLFREQLAEARSELNAFREQQNNESKLREMALKQQNCETKLVEMTAKQQEDRILRLENIIAACVALLADRNAMPDYLQRMIKQDAPSLLEVDGKNAPSEKIIDLQGDSALLTPVSSSKNHQRTNVLKEGEGSVRALAPPEFDEYFASNEDFTWESLLIGPSIDELVQEKL